MSSLLLRLVLSASGLVVAGGVALRLIPPLAPSVPPGAPGVAAAVPAVELSGRPEDGAYDSIIEHSIFSPDRAAPAERFVPTSPGSAARGPASANPRSRAVRAGPRFRLVGVASGPLGKVAIIDVDPAVPGAEVFRVGDRIGTARVLEIRENAVVLVTPEGRIILSLPPTIRRSP